jgi:hypothetical protein
MEILLSLSLIRRKKRRLERQIIPSGYDSVLSGELDLLISAIEILEKVQ